MGRYILAALGFVGKLEMTLDLDFAGKIVSFIPSFICVGKGLDEPNPAQMANDLIVKHIIERQLQETSELEAEWSSSHKATRSSTSNSTSDGGEFVSVAITSRFPKHRNVQEIVSTLQRHHQTTLGAPVKLLSSNATISPKVNVRVVTGQTGIQDFCFLHKATHTLVGNGMSAYVKWAAILGSSKVSKLYLYRPTLDKLLSTAFGNHDDGDGDTGSLIGVNGGDVRHVIRNKTAGAAAERRTSTKETTSKNDLIQMFGFHWTNPILNSKVRFDVLD